ncbi:transcriptional regulator, AlpA family [Nitrosomonas sp. PY1]|uniref:helix-turn-helix transcriptional regulator n=1 Tax=Nitrosomonas sp. PY1 TaxID=1803906 RepID=UPI001FC80EB1|nr:AlpA family phage regulatory protein [Nitrosomonas sp. PY1]GKS70224.1 transcriptional regulator, AlpA family [Nitrosomonas sp. PY1]
MKLTEASSVLHSSLTNFDSYPDSAFVRVGTVAELLACSKVSVWRMSKNGTLPKPIKISNRITCWQVGQLRKSLALINREV